MRPSSRLSTSAPVSVSSARFHRGCPRKLAPPAECVDIPLSPRRSLLHLLVRQGPPLRPPSLIFHPPPSPCFSYSTTHFYSRHVPSAFTAQCTCPVSSSRHALFPLLLPRWTRSQSHRVLSTDSVNASLADTSGVACSRGQLFKAFKAALDRRSGQRPWVGASCRRLPRPRPRHVTGHARRYGRFSPCIGCQLPQAATRVAAVRGILCNFVS